MVVQGSPSKPAKPWTPLLLLLYSMGRRFDVVDAPVDAGVVLEKLETLGMLLLLLSRCSCCCCLDAVVERSTGSKLLTMLLMETQKHKAVDAVVGKNARNTTIGG